MILITHLLLAIGQVTGASSSNISRGKIQLYTRDRKHVGVSWAIINWKCPPFLGKCPPPGKNPFLKALHLHRKTLLSHLSWTLIIPCLRCLFPSPQEQRIEMRRLKHLHRQQGDLDNFLQDQMKEFLPKLPKSLKRETSQTGLVLHVV